MREELAASPQYRKELRGWLSYAFARSVCSSLPADDAHPHHSEVFVIVSLTLFLPISLEQFARDNGFVAPDLIKPCAGKVKLSAEEGRCLVKIGWLWVDTASFR